MPERVYGGRMQSLCCLVRQRRWCALQVGPKQRTQKQTALLVRSVLILWSRFLVLDGARVLPLGQTALFYCSLPPRYAAYQLCCMCCIPAQSVRPKGGMQHMQHRYAAQSVGRRVRGLCPDIASPREMQVFSLHVLQQKLSVSPPLALQNQMKEHASRVQPVWASCVLAFDFGVQASGSGARNHHVIKRQPAYARQTAHSRCQTPKANRRKCCSGRKCAGIMISCCRFRGGVSSATVYLALACLSLSGAMRFPVLTRQDSWYRRTVCAMQYHRVLMCDTWFHYTVS